MVFILVEHFWYKDACWAAAGIDHQTQGGRGSGKEIVVLGQAVSDLLLQPRQLGSYVLLSTLE